MLQYQIENNLSLEEFKSILVRSTLGERRPIGETDRLVKMLENANLIITARIDGQLIGVSRSITDFAYCTYLSDLAVDETYQKQGIGKELIRQTKIASLQAKVILLSAPAAVHYYPKIGMKQMKQCYILSNANDLK